MNTDKNSVSPEELFNEYKHLVETTLYRMLGQPQSVALSKGMEYDDLIQIGSVGLWQACKNHDSQLSKFQTHAINHIRWAVKNALNMSNIIKYNHNNLPDKEDMYNIVSLSQPFYNNDRDSNITVGEVISDDQYVEPYDEVLFEQLVEALYDMLTPREKEIVDLKLEGKANKNIAKQLNVSPPLITYYLNNIRDKFESLRDREGVLT